MHDNSITFQLHFNYNSMTKLIKKSVQKNVHLHMSDVWAVIDDFLPKYGYVERVQNKLKKKTAAGTIRNIRNKRKGDLDVIKALLKISLEEKAKVESLAQQANNN